MSLIKKNSKCQGPLFLVVVYNEGLCMMLNRIFTLNFFFFAFLCMIKHNQCQVFCVFVFLIHKSQINNGKTDAPNNKIFEREENIFKAF